MKHNPRLAQVTDAIVHVTRYPREVLTPEADLENDLGIDSVKLVEILVALGKEFNIDLMKQERDPTIRTIQQIAQWVENILDQSGYHKSSPSHLATDLPKPHVQTLNSSDASRHVVSGDKSNGNSVSGLPVDGLPVRGYASNGQGGYGHTPNGTVGNPHDRRSLTGSGEGINGHVAHDHAAHRQPTSGTEAHYSQPMRRSVGQTFNRVSTAHLTPPPHHLGAIGPSLDSQQLTGYPGQEQNGDETLMGYPAQTLRGRVALVTGSGRGVGRTIARLLARRGATVIVNSFHSREAGEATTAEIISQGGQAIHLWGSVANPHHVDNIFDEIIHRVGQLDILVCNASDGRIGSFKDVTSEDWERAFRTNVIGHHQCALRASPLMQQQGGGVIITMSSIAARRYVEGLGGQGVVKAAVESMTRHLACELAPYGIRVNCVSGGPVYGQVMSLYPESRTTLNYWETLVLDGELCSPMDLASTVAFLVSDEARGVNGAVWNVDHGLSTRSHSRPLPRAMQHPTPNSVLT